MDVVRNVSLRFRGYLDGKQCRLCLADRTEQLLLGHVVDPQQGIVKRLVIGHALVNILEIRRQDSGEQRRQNARRKSCALGNLFHLHALMAQELYSFVYFFQVIHNVKHNFRQR